MAQTAFYNFGKGLIKIGTTASPTDQHECSVSNFTITPSANQVNIPGTYCAGPTVLAQQSTFAIQMEWLSDWGANSSLSKLLWDNDGSPLYYSFEPDQTTNPGAPTATGQLIAIAGTFGGPGDNVWTNSQPMPCVAKPVLTDPT